MSNSTVCSLKNIWKLVLNTETVMFDKHYVDPLEAIEKVFEFNQKMLVDGVYAEFVSNGSHNEIRFSNKNKNKNDYERQLKREEFLNVAKWIGKMSAHTWSMTELRENEEYQEFIRSFITNK